MKYGDEFFKGKSATDVLNEVSALDGVSVDEFETLIEAVAFISEDMANRYINEVDNTTFSNAVLLAAIRYFTEMTEKFYDDKDRKLADVVYDLVCKCSTAVAYKGTKNEKS